MIFYLQSTKILLLQKFGMNSKKAHIGNTKLVKDFSVTQDRQRRYYRYFDFKYSKYSLNTVTGNVYDKCIKTVSVIVWERTFS